MVRAWVHFNVEPEGSEDQASEQNVMNDSKLNKATQKMELLLSEYARTFGAAYLRGRKVQEPCLRHLE